ncbi:hypothetical protein SAY87_003838 [Trapa incisa]|uniref:C2H2-type domain-containing protein n=1 Tax=Trapa incisa TaxID=236973 RepID=A0AAN7KT97_9MYRT|nr:hypothetical protein SAY87_003838 [Trapa incisa]
MALVTFLPDEPAPFPPPPDHSLRKQSRRKGHPQLPPSLAPQKPNPEKNPTGAASKQPSSWGQFKNLLTCKQVESGRVHDPSRTSTGSYPRIASSCGSICSFRDVVHVNTRVVHRADSSSPESSSLGQEAGLLSRRAGSIRSSSSRSLAGSTSKSHNGGSVAGGGHSSSRGMQFRKLSGCYECHMIVDPSRYPYAPRTTICPCPQCGEVFPKIESLELHQAVRHAVSELGPEDSGRNIVEIIFKSSWLKKDNPICRIERILKVHNTQRTIQRFEDCRDAVKARAMASTRRNPRCAADGNELLRFHCTTLSCSLGHRGSTSLCGSVPGCGVCTIIRNGFQGKSGTVGGVRTMASSGRAHDSLRCTDGRRAMLVCRVIAGRVKRLAAPDDAADAVEEEGNGRMAVAGSYDSVAASVGVFSNLEDLLVFNPTAILTCFVVIYKAMES